MFGIYWLFSQMPIWAIALVLWLATDGALHLMRDRLEGLGYQVSYSAKFGDAGLIVAVLIAAAMLQRDGTHVPEWLQIGWLQLALLIGCIALGIAVSWLTLNIRSGQAADVYHDIVIAPAILFFAITLVPVIWYNARWLEALVVVAAVVVWGLLVAYDIKSDRMNQRKWLVNHGFAIKGEIPKQ